MLDMLSYSLQIVFTFFFSHKVVQKIEYNEKLNENYEGRYFGTLR